jgi:hypothetical protein
MFTGIALGGGKGAGKTTIQDYILATRDYTAPIFAKQGIVKAYEKAFGHSYDKARDDGELVPWSTKTLAGQRVEIVLGGLQDQLDSLGGQFTPVNADLRFKEENCWFEEHGFLQIKVDSDEEHRIARLTARDGSLKNYKPNDPTETGWPHLKYNYGVENNSSFRTLFLQVESILERYFVRKVHRQGGFSPQIGHMIRIINPKEPEFWEVFPVTRVDPSTLAVAVKKDVIKALWRDDVIGGDFAGETYDGKSF